MLLKLVASFGGNQNGRKLAACSLSSNNAGIKTLPALSFTTISNLHSNTKSKSMPTFVTPYLVRPS